MTKEYRCLKVHKSVLGGIIVGYCLETLDGTERVDYVPSAELKRMIGEGTIKVVNLTLTKNNRLILRKDKRLPIPTKDTLSYRLNKGTLTEEIIQREIAKYNLFNRCIRLYNDYNKPDKDCFLIKEDSHYYFLYIPDNVTSFEGIHTKNFSLYNKSRPTILAKENRQPISTLSDIYGCLTVYGGRNLVYFKNLFANCTFLKLDLRGFHTESAKDMSGLFMKATINTLDISTMTLTEGAFVTNMFKDSKIDKIIMNTSRKHKNFWNSIQKNECISCKKVEWVKYQED